MTIIEPVRELPTLPDSVRALTSLVQRSVSALYL